MKDAIRQLMRVHVSESGDAVAETAFPEDFPGFKGHFDGRPVLPGVCLVLAALVVAEALEGSTLTLREIISAKFFSPLAPNAPVRIVCSLLDGVVRAKMTGGAGRVAEIRFKVDHA